MKIRFTIIIVCVAFVIGTAVGFWVSSYFASRVMEFGTIQTSLNAVSMAYAPLKLLKSDRPEDATKVLELELDSSLKNIELVSATLKRPDILTNTAVVGARALK
jgi:uncharacterized membrane protein YfcA